ncbi:MAG: excinuclease ABC subunit C, partial [Bacteroidaceae bacterium]|nr:excinuclease ABC subunit C [Bacteroidaceae bacterium]
MKENTYYEEILKPIVQSLPEKPGCYQYLNSSGQVIYVGKAKNLKRRVSSYFLKEQQSNKTKLLVKQIADIKYIVVNNEWDALLLENNLIKKYKPKYNILLKDDKTYPSICITNEPFPRIFKTRNIIRNGSSYYGPYSHVGTLNALLNLISEVYNIRTCKLTLNENDIQKGNYKECLEYHIKRCKAPCIGLQSKEEYGKEISEIREILKGRTIELNKNIVEEMKKESALLNFEKAQVLKEKYLTLTAFTERSQVVSGSLDNIDVYSVEEDEDVVFVNYMHLSNGCINQAFTFEYKRKLDETIEEMLLTGFAEMRTRYKSRAKEVIVP